MNESYGLAPDAYKSAGELRLLLSAFGPYTGKYILTFPSDANWRERVIKMFEQAGDIERERLKVVLNRAMQNSVFIDRPNQPWNDRHDWLRNALNYWLSVGDQKKIFVSDDSYEEIKSQGNEAELSCAIAASDPEPLAPADGQIESSPEAYWNVSKILCFKSREVHFVDPYVNPLKKSSRDVLEFYLKKLGNFGRLQSIHFWTREKELAKYEGRVDIDSIRSWLNKNVNVATNKKLALHFNMLADEASKDKLHARYLLTEKGGIKFDQGFQCLPDGRRNKVSPVGNDLHQRLYRQLRDQTFDFKISNRIIINQS